MKVYTFFLLILTVNAAFIYITNNNELSELKGISYTILMLIAVVAYGFDQLIKILKRGK